MDRDSCVDVVYCAFIEAFDTIPYGHLGQVLEYYSFDKYFVNWVKIFLSWRRQRMVVNGSEYTWYDFYSGIT